jgi:hypothetical protein
METADRVIQICDQFERVHFTKAVDQQRFVDQLKEKDDIIKKKDEELKKKDGELKKKDGELKKKDDENVQLKKDLANAIAQKQ